MKQEKLRPGTYLDSIKFAVQMKAVGTLHRVSFHVSLSSWLFVFNLHHTYTHIKERNIALLRLAFREETAEKKWRGNSVNMNRKLSQAKIIVEKKAERKEGGKKQKYLIQDLK